MRSLAVNAAKGQHRAQRLFSQLLAEGESSRSLLHAEYVDKAITYKIEWEKELRLRTNLGVANQPDSIPHPDHVKFDFRSGKVSIVGPVALEEKEELYCWRTQLPKLQDALAGLRDALEMDTDPDEIADLKDNIAR